MNYLEKEISVNNLSINYKMAGNGKPILILHGWASNSDRWVEVINTLVQNNYMVVVPDLPGFGKSQKPESVWGLNEYAEFVKTFIDEVMPDKFILLGHSFGGALALKLGTDSSFIDKLFLVSAAIFRRRTLKLKMLKIIVSAFKVFSFLPFYSYARRFFYRFAVKSDYNNMDGVMKQSYLKIVEHDISNLLDKINLETVIVWGEKDDITPMKDAIIINKRIKGSKLKIIKNAKHSLAIDNSKELADIIINN